MPGFEILEHTADVGLVAYGSDLKEAFANAATGLFSLIAELDEVEERVSYPVEVQAPDEEALLVAWLNELIYLFETEHVVFRRFEVRELAAGRLEAEVYGEPFDPSRHQLKTGVKGATYHMLEVSRADGCRVQVILDV